MQVKKHHLHSTHPTAGGTIEEYLPSTNKATHRTRMKKGTLKITILLRLSQKGKAQRTSTLLIYVERA